MKTLFLTLNIFCLLLAACTTTTRLPTDSDEIDISGRWNATDSEIATQEIMNKLTNSNWYGSLNKEPGNFINFKVKHVSGTEDLSSLNNYESIKEAFEAHIEQHQYWRSLKEEETIYSVDYFLEPTISKSESVSEKETVYLYTLTIKIIDRAKGIVYQEQETVKKYIKN